MKNDDSLSLSLSLWCSRLVGFDVKDKLSLCSWDRLVPCHCGIVGKYLQLSHGNKIASCRGLDLCVTDISPKSFSACAEVD